MNELTSVLKTLPTPATKTPLGRCKLSLEEAREAKQRYERGETLRAIAEHYGCCHATIMNVVHGNFRYESI